MHIFFLATLLFQGEISLGRHEVAFTGELLQIGPQGEYLAATENTLLLYDSNTDHQIVFKTKGMIFAFHFDGEIFLVSEIRKGAVMAAYSRDGELIAEASASAPFARYFFYSDFGLIATPLKSSADLDLQPHFINAHLVDYSVQNGILTFDLSPHLGKITKRQHEHAYNFRKMWLVDNDPNILAVNEVEPRVYIFDPESRRKERRDGTKSPTFVPSYPLELPKYATPPKTPFGLTEPVRKSELARLNTSWWNSWSRFTWFSKYKDGYIIAYQVPDCYVDNPKECPSFHLGIQPLDKNFRPQGKLIETSGMMMGINSFDQICVFQPNPIVKDKVTLGSSPKIVFY